jgi:amino acid adenylation domain-containing protein
MVQIKKYGFISLLDLRTDIELSKKINFNTLYVFENLPEPSKNNVFRLTAVNNLTHYPFNFLVFPKDRMVKIVYDEKKFPKVHVNNLLKDYRLIVSSIIQYKASSILDILKLLSKSREKITPTKTNKISVIDLFIKIAENHSNHIALEHLNQKTTYKDLHHFSDKIAKYLIENFPSSSTNIVPILIKKSKQLIYCILGVLKSYHAYLPIDIEYPITRIIYMVKKIKSKFIILEKDNTKMLHILKQHKIRYVFIENIFTYNYSKKGAIKKNSTPHELFNVIFTSGSTGHPKGVMVKNESVVNLIENQKKAFEINLNTRVLSFSATGFDAFTSELFTVITAGATLVLPDNKNDLVGMGLFDFLKNKKITLVTLPPSVLSTLPHKKRLPDLKVMVIAGEAPWKTLVQNWSGRNIKLMNAYGPTETTVCATINTSLNFNSATNIGWPLKNMHVYIMDSNKNILPPGAIGEIYIHGRGLSLGYINDKKLTNNSFLKINLNNKTTTLYKTGDIGAFEYDASIRYIGRKDNQIKLNGYRIELDEISKILLSLNIVKTCAVLSKEVAQGVITLTAIIVPQNYIKAKEKKILSQIFKEARQHLPHYMIPSKVILLNEMPMTPNKKIDYALLKKISDEKNLTEIPNAALESRADIHVLLDIWKSVLNVSSVDHNASFFHSGGTSLLAALLIAKINENFLINIGTESIFMHETFTTFSDYIKKQLQCSRHFKNIKKHSIPNPIVLLRENSGNINLFLIHPVGGNIFWYANLAKYTSHTFSLYAIRDPGLIKKKLYFSSIEEMSAFYLSMIRKIQKRGPYYIGGASYGATIAVEIAHQLSAQGEKINFIGLFDGWALYPDEINSQDFMQKNMWRQYKEMKNLDKKSQHLLSPYVNLHWHRANLLVQYKIKYIDQILTLFKAKTMMPVLKPLDCPDNYWRKYAKKLITYSIPGSHETMFYHNNVKELAKVLSHCIKQPILRDLKGDR